MTSQPTYKDLQEQNKNLQKSLQDIKKNEKQFRALFEKSKNATLILHNNKLVDCNPATLKLFGYQTKEEIFGLHPSEISPLTQIDGQLSFSKAEAMMEAAIIHGTHHFEWEHIRADGQVLCVDIHLTTICSEKENTIVQVVIQPQQVP